MQLKCVVVTGLGALTPIENTLQRILGRSCERKKWRCPITYYDTEKHKTKFACEIKNFNVEDFIDKKRFAEWISLLFSICYCCERRSH